MGEVAAEERREDKLGADEEAEECELDIAALNEVGVDA